MNLSQLNDKLQSVEKVIQFCEEKKRCLCTYCTGLFLNSIFMLNSNVKISFFIKLLGESRE